MIWRWDKIFLNELFKYFFITKLFKRYKLILISGFYAFLFIFHWIFVAHYTNIVNSDLDGLKGENITTMIFHLSLIFIAITIFFFEKAGPGVINKKNISKDKDSNLVGKILDLIESK
jgi:hypothetical protein